MDWRNWRDRWLGDPATRVRIGRLPIGRAIADRHARRLFGIVAGFAHSQLLAAAVELGVLESLAAGPRRWDELTTLPPAGADALRQGLIALGLIEERRGLAALTVDGLVVATDPGLRAMIAHNRLLYADMASPAAMLKGEGGGSVAAFWPYAGKGDAAGYSALMAASNAMVADDVLAAGVLDRSAHVIDVGGGDGAFLKAVRRRHPALSLTLVDLPEVLAGQDLTRERIAPRGVAPDESLPRGADTVTLLRVLHDQDDDGAAALLKRVAAALPPGGRVVVAEPMARPGRDPQTAYFAAYFAAMRSGRLRTPAAVAALLRDAGFRIDRAPRTSGLVHLMIGVQQG